MTDEQINEAIWKLMGMDNGDCYCDECRPHYTQDLNAMHEAEKVLTYEQLDEYYIILVKMMVRPFHATARQRAEAFLRTLGKREEGE